MSETRCPECQCLLKDKDLKNDKCWKCGFSPVREIIEKTQNIEVTTKSELKEQKKQEKMEQKRQRELEREKKELLRENRTLSEKFGGLETYKMFLMTLGMLSTGGYIVFLFEWKANNVPNNMILLIILGSIILFFLMWYSIINISRIINFLFKLDQTKNNVEGKKVKYYENGQKEWEGTFKDGKVVEVIGEWNEDGSVKK